MAVGRGLSAWLVLVVSALGAGAVAAAEPSAAVTVPSAAGDASTVPTKPEPEGATDAASWLDERLGVSADARSVIGVGSRAGMRLSLVGAGTSLRLTSVLDARVLLLAMAPAGTLDDGEPAPFGLGGEAGLYLSPWQRAAVRPHAFGSAGIFAFPTAPFLPGGSHYDFMLRVGVGVDVSASDRVVIGLDGFATHLSNGQGIGEHNPAFDGYGAALRMSYSLSPRRRLPSRWQATQDRDGNAEEDWPRALPAFIVDGSVGYVDDVLIGSGRARLAQRLVGGLLAIVDGESGSLEGQPYGEIGVGLVTHFEAMSLGAHGGYRRFAGLDTAVLTVQVEGHATDEVSLLAMGHHESGGYAADLWRGVVAVRAYPLPSLLLEAGMGFLGSTGDEAQAPLDIVGVVGVEWAPPLPLGAWQLSVFGESQATGIRLVGLRIAHGVGATPRQAARERAWRRMR